ncbi:MAG: gamma-glutamyltransferase, partial [SAR202 cluster bacterium]|nr:gamma-glutamyltransferase [SAR202 cluster bacterium]
DHEMNLQEAVEAPRLWSNGPVTLIESMVEPSVIAELESMGHRLQRVPAIANCMNSVQLDASSGMLLGAACWRGDGSPVGISGGFARSAVKWWGSDE